MKTTNIMQLEQPFPLVMTTKKIGKKLMGKVLPIVASLIVCDYDDELTHFKTFPIVMKNERNDANTKVLADEKYEVLDIHKGEKITWDNFVHIVKYMDTIKDDENATSITMEELYTQLSLQGVEIVDMPDLFVINVCEGIEKENSFYFESENAWFVDDVKLVNDKIISSYFLDEIKFLREINPEANILILNAFDNEDLANEKVGVIRDKVCEIFETMKVKPYYGDDLVKKLIGFFNEKKTAEKNDIINFVFNEFGFWKEEYLDVKREEVWYDIEGLGIIKENKDADQTTYSLNFLHL